MRKADLIWKPRFAKGKRNAVIDWIKKHYDQVQLLPDRVRITHPKDCTKFIWIFMLSKAFSDLQPVPSASPNRREPPHAIPGYKEKARASGKRKAGSGLQSRRKRRAS